MSSHLRTNSPAFTVSQSVTRPELLPFARRVSRLISARTRPGSGRAWTCRVGYTDPELGKMDEASVRRRYRRVLQALGGQCG